MHRLLRGIEVGGLTVVHTGSGAEEFFGVRSSPIQGRMIVHDDRLWWDVVTLSELGLGMGYVRGLWESPSPYHVLLVLMLNEGRLRRVLMRGHRLSPRALRIVRALRHNVGRNHLVEHCREQIGLTYDIGNDFYRWMLGPSMTYSCAIWPHPDATLEEAQVYKMELILEKLDVRSGHRVLEIGSGWGTFCNHLRVRTGARVRGIALSRNQVDGARRRYPDLEFDYLDYRQERGAYDRIVSVGMLEHVGVANLDTYCAQLARLLEPGGRALIHWLQPWEGVLIDERRRRHPHWGSVLMPGAECATHSEMVLAAMKTGALRVVHTETFGIHYARTGRSWLENLERHRSAILDQYAIEVYKAHEYAWHLGSAAMETGYCLMQMVLEKAPYGSGFRTSAIDAVASRRRSLGRPLDGPREDEPMTGAGR